MVANEFGGEKGNSNKTIKMQPIHQQEGNENRRERNLFC